MCDVSNLMLGDTDRDTDVFVHEFKIRRADVSVLLPVPLRVNKAMSTVAQQ